MEDLLWIGGSNLNLNSKREQESSLHCRKEPREATSEPWSSIKSLWLRISALPSFLHLQIPWLFLLFPDSKIFGFHDHWTKICQIFPDLSRLLQIPWLSRLPGILEYTSYRTLLIFRPSTGFLFSPSQVILKRMSWPMLYPSCAALLVTSISSAPFLLLWFYAYFYPFPSIDTTIYLLKTTYQ